MCKLIVDKINTYIYNIIRKNKRGDKKMTMKEFAMSGYKVMVDCYSKVVEWEYIPACYDTFEDGEAVDFDYVDEKNKIAWFTC